MNTGARWATGIAITLTTVNLGVLGWTVVVGVRRRACAAIWFDPLTGAMRPKIREEASTVMAERVKIAKTAGVLVSPDELARATFVQLGKTRPCVGTFAEQSVTAAVWPVLQAMAADRLGEIEGVAVGPA